ncbi:type II CRISPR RNA-guided endonuclease Cas9 [Viscerimonas tarda]
MSNIIGIDLGSNSAGWAIRDTSLEDNQIIDYGVLTFDKGVATEKGIEFPKVQKRTDSRSKRRNYQAEKYQKWSLLEFLIEKQMCPLTTKELNKWRKYTKGQKREYPQTEEFINWLHFDFDGDGKPDFHLFGKEKDESHYIFRVFAINEELKAIYQNNPYILGRILYQLVQRRGFRGRDEEEAKTMLQGSEKTGTAGRDEIATYIEQYKTLGAALYYYQKEKGGRIRQRYNLRRDYENELKEICKTQDINEGDYKRLWNAIIWQRPLRTQKGLVGKCIYERNKKRAPISHPLYEEYRTWVFINNLNIDIEDKQKFIKEHIYPLFYNATPDFTLNKIGEVVRRFGGKITSKFAKLTNEEKETLSNDEQLQTIKKKEKNVKVISAKLLKSFQDILGDDWKEAYKWDSIYDRQAHPEKKTDEKYTFEDIWHVLNTFDGPESLKKFALEKLNLDEEKAEKFSKLKLNQGYATLSLSAIKKILPFLQKGFKYSHAIYLANLYKVLGTDKITDDLIIFFSKEVEKIIDENKEQKNLNDIVNNLIQNELNDEYRYSIEVDRELDSDELSKIKTKIVDVLGEKTWDELREDKKAEISDYVSTKFKDFLRKSILSKKNIFIEQPRLHDQIFAFLQKTYNIPDERKEYLWHPSEQDNYVAASNYHQYTIGNKDIYLTEEKIQSFLAKHPDAECQGRSIRLLGSPEPISNGFKNPMALKSLHKLKQLLNYLLKIGKIDENTRVVIEIARELNDANKRKAIESWNKEREKENESYKKIIREINEECETNYDENDKILLRKIRLWKEQNLECLYTGKPIKMCDIFNGNNYDIEHTIPASVSFDSELKNLTLANSNYNRNIKKKLFPTQLPNYEDDVIIDDDLYTAIKPRLRHIEEKVEELEFSYDEWKRKASYATTKDIKNNCIQKYHMVKFDLDYWKSKLHTFTIKEHKSSWRNSQLKDTQIITKYALPYLKTVFKKVSVEKANVVNSFKEIYSMKLPYEKKDRNEHYHHATDAAILTLIPPFYERDKILLEYNEVKDRRTNEIYHEQPKDWENFSASKVLFIENEILINNLTDNRTTLSTYKKVRKRGRIEYLRYKDENGKWNFRLDKNGEKIPKVAQGDTIRGQLHGESFYGAIKLPKRDGNNKILFDENGLMILQDEIFLVIRKELVYKKDANSPGFRSLDEIEKVIVDRDLYQMIKKQVESTDFKTALTNGVYMLDKCGNKVNKIRRIRCRESMKYETAIKIHPHGFKSKKEYKHYTLAKNGENTLCLFYQNEKERRINILTISDVARLKFENDGQFLEEPYYNHIEIGTGKNKSNILLYAVLRAGHKVLFYKNNIEELKELLKDGSKNELSKRMFKIYQFEKDGRMKFRHHLAAGIDTELKKDHKEYSYFDINENPIFLRLSQKEWNFAVEGVDFIMNLDGTIKFNF